MDTPDMDEQDRARRVGAEFILDELRLAHTYLNIASNPLSEADTVARNSRHAAQLLKTINRLLAEGNFDMAARAEIVGERDRLHQRLSTLAGRAMGAP